MTDLEIHFRSGAVDKIRAMIEDAIGTDPYIPAGLAHDLVVKLRRESPEVLAEWLDAHADQLMRETVLAVTHARKTRVARRANRSVFRTAVERAEAGEPELLEGWLSQRFIANSDRVQKRLNDMVKEEVEFACESHESLAKGNAMKAAFLREIARRIGAKTVGEVYDNDTLNALWRSME